jgi:hypothetical protein
LPGERDTELSGTDFWIPDVYEPPREKGETSVNSIVLLSKISMLAVRNFGFPDMCGSPRKRAHLSRRVM